MPEPIDVTPDNGVDIVRCNLTKVLKRLDEARMLSDYNEIMHLLRESYRIIESIREGFIATASR